MLDSTEPAQFWLKFQVYSDGQNALRARQLSPLPSFHLFAHLPPELRLKIWDYLVTPRILLLACIKDSAAEEQLLDLVARPSHPRVPALLHVNHEARTLALAHYELTFGWKVPYALSLHDAAGRDDPAPPWSEPRVYFNFAQDAVYLAGELEPADSYGFKCSIASFLRREDTRRVRRVALGFRALGYGETGSQQMFSALYHVAERFSAPNRRVRVLVCVTEGDEWTNALLGGEYPLVPREAVGAASSEQEESVYAEIQRLDLGEGRYDRWARPQGNNVLQDIWKDWYQGSLVTTSLANTEFKLIREADLESYVADARDEPILVADQGSTG